MPLLYVPKNYLCQVAHACRRDRWITIVITDYIYSTIYTVDIMKADDFIFWSLLVKYLLGTYLGSKLPLQGIFLLQARQVTHLVGSFGDHIWEKIRYENIEIENLRVAAIPNGLEKSAIQELIYCLSKHKFINVHWNKLQYKYIPPLLLCSFVPFSASSHIISTCFKIVFLQQQLKIQVNEVTNATALFSGLGSSIVQEKSSNILPVDNIIFYSFFIPSDLITMLFLTTTSVSNYKWQQRWN